MIPPTDVACALVLLKQRFRLSISFINHLLKLLPKIPPSSFPATWHAVKVLLRNTNTAASSRITAICPSCSSASSSRDVCSQCKAAIRSSSKLKHFHNFNISDQLHRIIATNHSHLELGKSSANQTISDVCDGEIYRDINRSISDTFITLKMNVDGIQPNRGSNKSIWPITLVVNELPLDRRFSPENVILGGVWPGPSKPSRKEMTMFFQPLVNELIELEKGIDFFLPSAADLVPGQMLRMRIFLISACCDKPAQALIQNIPEPIATFGCGRCEIAGNNFLTQSAHMSDE